jgi:hypothetical protein
MRALAILLLVGCGTKLNDEPGRLVCKSDGKTFETRVARGALPAVQARADAAQLTGCKFEPGTASIAHWPVEYAAVAPVIPPPPDVPRPPSAPQNVPPTALENNRLAGSKTIVPDESTKDEIRAAGKDKVIGSYKLCITVDGEVSAVSQLKSTGFSSYDGKIISEMKTWKYMPYIYGGNATPVCTAVTFIFSVN